MKNSLYYRELTFENLLNTYYVVKKISKNKNKIKNYDLNLYANIYTLLNKLRENTYMMMPYSIFIIHKHKKRIVMANEVVDKIVHHFVMKYYLIPLLDKKLISQNVANRCNMGINYLSKLMYDYLNILNRKKKDIYALKLDIYNYFYCIDKRILLDKLSCDIHDKSIINLIKIILSETSKNYVKDSIMFFNNKYHIDIPTYSDNTGISIGSVISEFFGIYYLNSLDHFIKERLHCKYYARYQDDLVLFSYSKTELQKWWELINKEISKLHLKLNSKSNIYKLSNGLNFVGTSYRIINHKLVIRPCRKTIYEIRRKLNKEIVILKRIRV